MHVISIIYITAIICRICREVDMFRTAGFSGQVEFLENAMARKYQHHPRGIYMRSLRRQLVGARRRRDSAVRFYLGRIFFFF